MGGGRFKEVGDDHVRYQTNDDLNDDLDTPQSQRSSSLRSSIPSCTAPERYIMYFVLPSVGVDCSAYLEGRLEYGVSLSRNKLLRTNFKLLQPLLLVQPPS